jgi:hypothetical protein
MPCPKPHFAAAGVASRHLGRSLCGVALSLATVNLALAACETTSPPTLTPVLELYTSEGCSSCPPADRWLSTLKTAAAAGKVVPQAFHVGYWDYIGWVDRFATPAHTMRQREIASLNRLRSIYTPQLVRNAQDWQDYAKALDGGEPARASIALSRSAVGAYEATVTPLAGANAWSAYWTVTEHGHSSKVKAGENAGETLAHDFVVRQYVPVGDYRGEQRLSFRAIAGEAGFARQINLVVFDKANGKPLQALSLSCSG